MQLGTTHLLDRSWRGSSSSSHLLTGVGWFNILPSDRGGWFSAKRGIWAYGIVEIEPFLTPAMEAETASQGCG